MEQPVMKRQRLSSEGKTRRSEGNHQHRNFDEKENYKSKRHSVIGGSTTTQHRPPMQQKSTELEEANFRIEELYKELKRKDDRISRLYEAVKDGENALSVLRKRHESLCQKMDSLEIKGNQKLESENVEDKSAVNNSIVKYGHEERSFSSGNTVPKWIVRKDVCEDILKSNPDNVAGFLKSYLPKLFTAPEILLPEENLIHSAKWNEAEVVISYFCGPAYLDQLKMVLGKKRRLARNKIYQRCKSNYSIGVTADNKEVHYLLKRDNKWYPYSDEECKNRLRFESYCKSEAKLDEKGQFPPSFGYPDIYDYSNQNIIILQNSSTDGHNIYQIFPSGLCMHLSKMAASKKSIAKDETEMDWKHQKYQIQNMASNSNNHSFSEPFNTRY